MPLTIGDGSSSFPQRHDTMSLRTISNAESRGRRGELNVRWTTNRIDDIERSQPFYPPSRFTNKPDLHNVGDIEAAQTRNLHAALRNKPSYCYTNDDIVGSKPKPYMFKTARVVDPVDPVYGLPSCPLRPVTPPRFLRDGHSVADIQGTAPRVPRQITTRDNLSTMDIEGAQAGWKPRHKVRRRRECVCARAEIVRWDRVGVGVGGGWRLGCLEVCAVKGAWVGEEGNPRRVGCGRRGGSFAPLPFCPALLGDRCGVWWSRHLLVIVMSHH